MGYDVSNYEEVYYRFGSVSDVEELIKGCHMRGMRLLWI
jgi:glycosidase